MTSVWILAQAAGERQPAIITDEPVDTQQIITSTAPAQDNAPARKAPAEKPGGYSSLIFLGVMVVLMYLLLFRGPRKKQQEQKKMVHALKKNDRVRTIGGILGTIVDIKDDQITLKVDESNNTKIKLSASAVAVNMSEDKT